MGFTGTRYHGSSRLRSPTLAKAASGLPRGQWLGSQSPQGAMRLLHLLQPKGHSLRPAHPTEPSAAKVAGASASMFHTPPGRPSGGEEPGKPTIWGLEISASPGSQVMFLFLWVSYSCATLNLGVVSLNTGLLLRVCWYLACLLHVSSPQHLPNPLCFRVPEPLFRERHSYLSKALLCAIQRIGTFRNLFNPLSRPVRKR